MPVRPALIAALLLAASPSAGLAQLPSLGSLGGLAGAGGLTSGLSSAGVGNVAGLLGYCVKRKLLGGAGASSVLGKLTGQQGVTASPGYAAGQNGQLVTGNGGTLSLDSVKDKVKGKVCSLVLDRASGFAGRR